MNSMPRLVTATFIIFTFIVWPGAAQANGGPHNPNANQPQDCAWCHRTRSTNSTLITDNVTDLCLSCHGAGMGANTNVLDGVYLSTGDDAAGNYNIGAGNTPDGASLLGGGFESYRGKPVSSAHHTSQETSLAWGNGVARGQAAALSEGVTCTGCHDPHGSSNYRILRDEINGNPVSVPQVDEGPAKDYDTEQWGAGLTGLCTACHGAYNTTNPGSGSDESLLHSGGFAHRVDMSYQYENNVNPETVGLEGYHLPLAQSGNGDLVTCMTCHLPHGSSAQMASGAESRLLRLDNSGVCQVCHQK